ncbi:hypothetical protein MKJ04_16550 [Pontibacter sp. E15-1]|uniref:hypothetical protein n=1 Tax=Pontibacter sp. E15-1 TaxID=2919918 RepID=UPI001F4F73DB|nr:hypothetical protein [Pontibacter sp. E15-1]MCJ8166457.1 hypothetical protein [Pontibacter sp. E15-1]
MPYTPAILTSATNHLQKVFDVDHLPARDLEALHYKIAHLVQHLLRNDFNRLLHILYRIDVDERKVKEAMMAEEPEIIAERISRLILRRELQKAEIRFRYS